MNPILLSDVDTDVWNHLGSGVRPAGGATQNIAADIFNVLGTIGAFSSVVCIMVLVGIWLLRASDPQKSAELKEQVIWKFVVILLISSAAWIINLIWNAVVTTGVFFSGS